MLAIKNRGKLKQQKNEHGDGIVTRLMKFSSCTCNLYVLLLIMAFLFDQSFVKNGLISQKIKAKRICQITVLVSLGVFCVCEH